ncbi:MAG TPA: Calx-beta domain-containing protein [Polyangiaceae bacterium]|nr:Calx-beta domain-containing protein [Polyangiaceae bacterium]
MAFAPWLRLVLVGALLGVAGCSGNGGGGSGGIGGEGGEGSEGGAGGAPAELVTISIADAEMEEGNAGVTELTFTVSLSRASDEPVRVSYRTDNGTAFAVGDATIGRSDYVETSATLRFDRGETEQTFTVEINADVLNEADETFTVALSNPTGAEIEDGDARALILNDDELPTVSIERMTNVTELDSGTTTLQVALALSAPAARPATVDWTTLDDTAEAGQDYVANMGTAIFSPGETSQTIEIVLMGDVQDEPDEELAVQLSEPVNSQLDAPFGSVTILDNDLPAPVGPTLSISNATLNEGNAGSVTLTFTISLSQAATAAVSVDYATIDGTAIAGGVAATGGRDYVAASDTVTFAIGEIFKQVSVTVYSDTLNEVNETFTIELINAMGASVLDPQGVGTITNDDTAPTISVSNASVTEGAAGMRSASFVVSLSKSSGRDITVDFDTSDGTADAGADYAAATGALALAAGQTSGVVSIDVSGDLLNEASETFYLDLRGATNATILDNQGLGTINNDDALPEISIDNVAVTEGDFGITNAVFSVMLSTASGQDVSVAWTTGHDTATGLDYTAGSGNLNFPTGTTVRTISIAVNGDVTDEPNEAFTVDLYSPSNCIITEPQGVGTIITDDSTLPGLNIADDSVTEGNAGTLTLSLTVTLDTPSAQQITVNYGTFDGTALDTSDYEAASGTLIFDVGETSQSVDITIHGDTLHEPDETVLVTLSGAVNAFVADGDGVGTITDNDTAPTLSIDDIMFSEGNAGTQNATFTISLSAASGFPVSVSYATADGSAEEGGSAALGQDDYEATSDVALIAATQTSVQITVPINGDSLAEAAETFLVQLSAPQNATLADDQGQCTISNDDGLPTISIDDVSLVEGDAGTKIFTFTVTLSSISGSQASVSFATANGTALSGSDYIATSGSVVFDPGETTASIEVTVNGDKPPEGNANETFYINLSNALGASIADNQGLGTILNDD